MDMFRQEGVNKEGSAAKLERCSVVMTRGKSQRKIC